MPALCEPSKPPQATRTSARLSKPCHLTALSPELLEHILSFLAPHTQRTSFRVQLARLLLLSRKLTPSVRHKLFKRVILTIGAPRERDTKLVELLEGAAGEGTGVGEHVRVLKVRVPETTGADQLLLRDDPAAFLVPVAKLPQLDTLQLVTRVLRQTRGLQLLDVTARIGTRDEDQVAVDEELEEVLGAFEEALKGLELLNSLVVAVPHAFQKVQSLSEANGWCSPYVPALATWTNLTTIDFWRVRLVLPLAGVTTPTFRLQDLSISSSELGGEAELLWLLGGPDDNRGSQLRKLALKEVDFLSSPSSSSPLLAIFPSTAEPSFASTLAVLQLDLPHPISTPTPPHLLSSLNSLTSLELSGTGTSLPLLASLFPRPFFPHAPSKTLQTLHLIHTPSIPQQSLLDLLATPHAFHALRTLTIVHTGTHPRTWSWAQVVDTPFPVWEWDDVDWRKLEKWARGARVQLMKDGLVVDVEWSSGGEESEVESVDSDALFAPSSEQEEWDFRRDSGDESEEF
mgnify:FL=1